MKSSLKHTLPILGLLLICRVSLAERKNIVIIDTGFDVSSQSEFSCGEDKDFTNSTLDDTEHHGKYINTIINKKLNTSKYCVTNLKSFGGRTNSDNATTRALRHVFNLTNVVALNLSWGGLNPSSEERQLLKNLIKKGIKIYVAAGNEYTDLDWHCIYYPPCYNLDGIIVVGSTSRSSNYGSIVKRIESGVYIDETVYKIGTSFSVPRALKKDLE